MTPRIAFGLAALVLLVLGWWVWRQLIVPPAVRPVSTPTPTVAATVEDTPTPRTAPPGYRLAGVALGEPDSFAVVEAPGGSNVLYRVNAEIPGLGRLVRIEAERVLVSTEDGELELWLAPASTPTPTRTVMARALIPSRLRTPPPGSSTRESTPSAARGRPAS
jgi:hypothetical protein